MLYSQDPLTWVGDSEMGEILQFSMFIQGARGLSSTLGSLLWQAVPSTRKMSPRNIWLLKVSGVHFWKRQMATGNGDSILSLVK